MATLNPLTFYQRSVIFALLSKIAELARGPEGLPRGYSETVAALQELLSPLPEKPTGPVPASGRISPPEPPKKLLTKTPILENLSFFRRTQLLEETPQAFLMITIEELGLSNAYKPLKHEGLWSVGAIFAHGIENLIRLRGFGPAAYRDLINQLAEKDIYVLAGEAALRTQPPKLTRLRRPRTEYQSSEDELTPSQIRQLTEDLPTDIIRLPIAELNLRTWPYNRLDQEGIDTVGKILERLQTDPGLLHTRGAGRKVRKEVHRKVQALLIDHGITIPPRD